MRGRLRNLKTLIPPYLRNIREFVCRPRTNRQVSEYRHAPEAPSHISGRTYQRTESSATPIRFRDTREIRDIIYIRSCDSSHNSSLGSRAIRDIIYIRSCGFSDPWLGRFRVIRDIRDIIYLRSYEFSDRWLCRFRDICDTRDIIYIRSCGFSDRGSVGSATSATSATLSTCDLVAFLTVVRSVPRHPRHPRHYLHPILWIF